MPAACRRCRRHRPSASCRWTMRSGWALRITSPSLWRGRSRRRRTPKSCSWRTSCCRISRSTAKPASTSTTWRPRAFTSRPWAPFLPLLPPGTPPSAFHLITRVDTTIGQINFSQALFNWSGIRRVAGRPGGAEGGFLQCAVGAWAGGAERRKHLSAGPGGPIPGGLRARSAAYR